MSERIQSVRSERLQNWDRLECQRALQDLVDELVGPPHKTEGEYSAVSRYPAAIHSDLEKTSLRDLFTPLDGFRIFGGRQHEVLPEPLYMVRNKEHLEEVRIRAW